MLNSGGIDVNGNGKRRSFDRAFKVAAVRLVTEDGHKVAEVARELGINGNQLHRWKRQLAEDGEIAFPGKGWLTPGQEELRRLHRENADLRQERDILKKAVAIFSRRGPK